MDGSIDRLRFNTKKTPLGQRRASAPAAPRRHRIRLLARALLDVVLVVGVVQDYDALRSSATAAWLAGRRRRRGDGGSGRRG